MKKWFFSFVSIFIFLIAIGCIGKQPWQDRLASDTTKMQNEGWNKVDVLGVPGDWVANAWLNSPTAIAMNVGWIVDGVQHLKSYDQMGRFIAFRSYVKANGDSFSIVFEKKKPEPAVSAHKT